MQEYFKKKTIFCADSMEAPGTSKRFQILYRNEEVTLGTSVLYRAHVLVNGPKIEEALSRAHFHLSVELWFSEPTQPGNMACVSSRYVIVKKYSFKNGCFMWYTENNYSS